MQNIHEIRKSHISSSRQLVMLTLQPLQMAAQGNGAFCMLLDNFLQHNKQGHTQQCCCKAGPHSKYWTHQRNTTRVSVTYHLHLLRLCRHVQAWNWSRVFHKLNNMQTYARQASHTDLSTKTGYCVQPLSHTLILQVSISPSLTMTSPLMTDKSTAGRPGVQKTSAATRSC